MIFSLTDGKWRYNELISELQEGGLADLILTRPYQDLSDWFLGEYHGEFVTISLRPNSMMLRMDKYFEEIVDVFSKILDYGPFCQYQVRSERHISEWSPEPDIRERRLKELKMEEGKVRLGKKVVKNLLIFQDQKS